MSNLPQLYLGKCGAKVSNLCLGTRTFGHVNEEAERAYAWNAPGQCDETLSHRLLDRYVECGGNFVDTANVYNIGATETVVGSWLQQQEREKIVLATKVGVMMSLSAPNDCGLSRKNIMFSFEESLKRLKTHYVDLYITHVWDDGTPLEETLSTLTDLVHSGRVRYLGLSNVTAWQLQKIIDLTKYKGYEPFVSLQAQYSLLCRETEWDLLEVCKEEGLGFHAWSPLKGGWLTGKMTRSGPPPGSRAHWAEKMNMSSDASPSFSQFSSDERAWRVLDVLGDISKETGKSIPQISLKWILQQDGVSSIVIGAKTQAQLDDNLGAGTDSWQLTREQLDKLEKASNVPVPYPWGTGWKRRLAGNRKRDGVRIL
ncbi:1-deoxyxylulose-5-phosphate synthase YajO-like [Oscarella lobularis]|uniref:1-deoxyxylulose-5-phosphate synthase YajO-like n=1 Tax=Oscarella lobularis TaxID=121494 RepID=UPI0033133952